jgi:GTP cyclohydrolase I
MSEEHKVDWSNYMLEAVRLMLEQPDMAKCISEEHLKSTPMRVVKAFGEYFWGVGKDASKELRTSFQKNSYDQMIIVAHVEFQSFCAHHLCPFIGTYSFAYLPDERIVGLSKIPRMVEVLAARPQVQEELSRQIVETFQATVQPKGCGVIMDAYHTCMSCRGVRKWATTRTTALSGTFHQDSVKSEFLNAVGPVRPLGI